MQTLGFQTWRRRRDSNPRYGNSPYGGLANRWFQPLTHVSGSGTAKRGYSGAIWKLQPARLTTPLAACDARETFHRAQLASGDATPLSFQESHAQKALARADVLIRQSPNTPAIPAGERVDVLRL